jgi:oligopeptide/dipeptide ABC transporter ATP-binding protein
MTNATPSNPQPAPHLLSVRGLKVVFPAAEGEFAAVDGISFNVPEGGRVGIVGESGSGKSLTALSLLRLVRQPGRIAAGSLLFRGRDILMMSEQEMRSIRGNEIALICQDPMTSWNPVRRVGIQIQEAMLLHDRVEPSASWRRTIDLLGQVGIPAAEERARAYPHQFSGGMRQRGMIAMGISNGPQLLIADEPTTALDVTIQDQIIRLLRRLNAELGTAILLITHNMALVAGLCDHVIVMYGGRIIERGSTRDIFYNPQHPYTRGLLKSVPRLNQPRNERLMGIPGQPLTTGERVRGCQFHPRCPLRESRCAVSEPLLDSLAPGHDVRCWVRTTPAEARH